MAYDGKHRRWMQDVGKPENKYSFSKYLVNKGDWIRTNPLCKRDIKKINDAAYQWAWYKGYAVKCVVFRVDYDMYEVEITLVSKVKRRDFG